jgi:hypothetical protein
MTQRLRPGFSLWISARVRGNFVPATPLSRLSTETRGNLSTGEITHILSPATKNSRSILTPKALLADLNTCPIGYSWWKIFLRLGLRTRHSLGR